MLQQTQVARVVERYEPFLGRFPTLESVAAASRAQVREAWQGLGYYARAHNLHALARQLVRDMQEPPANGDSIAVPATLPSDPTLLRALPGVGPYTAGAVASFAYERSAALVDTNVARVLTRVFAPRYDSRTPAGRRVAWTIAEQLLPRSGGVAYVHNQALMELGALVCTARRPRCGVCPVRRMCKTQKR
jgi:A/G-specific adenine glycosylase